jgi:hypothetical protein
MNATVTSTTDAHHRGALSLVSDSNCFTTIPVNVLPSEVSASLSGQVISRLSLASRFVAFEVRFDGQELAVFELAQTLVPASGDPHLSLPLDHAP